MVAAFSNIYGKEKQQTECTYKIKFQELSYNHSFSGKTISFIYSDC